MSSDAHDDLTMSAPVDAARAARPAPAAGRTADDTPTDEKPAELADRVAAAVLAVPGVHDLHGGVLGEVATYLPGRRVNGVRLREDETHIHLVLSWDAPVAITTAAVRAQVAVIVPGPIHVAVEDVSGPAAEPLPVPAPRS